MPTEVLELSFYKLLEQFFYNQDLISKASSEGNQSSEMRRCRHSFHCSTQMVIRYGSIKIHVKYEHLDRYSLDLIHFAKEPGTISLKESEKRIKTDLMQLTKTVKIGTQFIETSVEFLS